MDATTRAVREMYEEFPYPSGAPEMRVGFDARYVLSLVAQSRPEPGPIRVLDAGCGRGLGLLGAAQLQPDVSFVGVDINRRAIAEARDKAAERGLTNVSFQEVDLTTLEGLEAPPGGFDVIHSSGVVHHMTDPEAALARLRGVLAPHGVIVLMVYGRQGRDPYARVTRAVDALAQADAPLSSRLDVARLLTMGLAHLGGPWDEASRLDDVEFVDRYLHIQETSYDVPALHALIDSAGLRFLRWCDPHAWSVDAKLPEGPIRDLARELPEPQRSALIEQVTQPRTFEAYVCHPHNGPRPPLRGHEASSAWFAVSPEGTFELVTRALKGHLRTERLTFRSSSGEELHFPAGPLATAALVLRDQVDAFRGADFLAAMEQLGIGGAQAGQALGQLLQTGVLYTPHPCDS